MNELNNNSELTACGAVDAALHSFLDGGEIDLVAETNAHCTICPDCRGNVLAAISLRRALQLTRPVVVEAKLTSRIIAAVKADKVSPWRNPNKSRGGWIWAAVAASLLLTAGAMTLRYLSTAPVETQPPAPDIAGTRPIEPPALRDQFAEAGSLMVTLTRRTADQTVEPTRKLFPDMIAAKSLDVVGQFPKAMDPAVQSLQQVRQGAESGFEPVAHSARRALSMFLDMPPLDRDRKPDF